MRLGGCIANPGETSESASDEQDVRNMRQSGFMPLALRTIAFIDAGQFRPGIITSRLSLPEDRRFDWVKFTDFLAAVAGCPPVDAHYFDSLDAEASSRLGQFHIFLRNQLGFQLHFLPLKDKPRKCPHCTRTYFEPEQKGVDVSITVSMLKLAYSNAYDQAILCTGDGDFAPLATFLRDSLGKRVIVIGWEGGVAPVLRDSAYRTVILNKFSEELIGDRER